MTIIPDPADNGTPEQGREFPAARAEIADLINRTSTADLYDLLAATLTELDARGQRIGAVVLEQWAPKLPPGGEFIPLLALGGELASIDHQDGDGWSAAYYTEDAAEEAAAQYGAGQQGGASDA